MASARELTAPVDVAGADGRLRRDAVGRSRTPAHRWNVRGRWGRQKRWEWSFDRRDPRRPWRVRGAGVDLGFVPEYHRRQNANLGLVGGESRWCVGAYRGEIIDADGRPRVVEGLRGTAEDVRVRW